MESVGSRCDVVFYEGAEHAFFNHGDHFIDTLYQSDLFLKIKLVFKGKPYYQKLSCKVT